MAARQVKVKDIQKKKKSKRRIRYEHTPPLKRALVYIILTVLITLTVEMLNQGTVAKMTRYLTQRTLYFGFNCLIVLTTLVFAELFKRRIAVLCTMSSIWIILGVTNRIVIGMRTSPFISGDMKLSRDTLNLATVYFSIFQLILLFMAAMAVIVALILLYSYTKRRRRVNYPLSVAAVTSLTLITLFVTLLSTKAGILPALIKDRVDAYGNYGFITCFTVTFGASGVAQPQDYSPDMVDDILDEIDDTQTPSDPETVPLDNVSRFSEKDDTAHPNIIFLQLESYFDVDTLVGLELSEDPMPVWHSLLAKYPNADLYVPTVGGGTANVEFEVMSGMNMDFFSGGETPYESLITKTTLETIAYILRDHGYYCTTVHDNICTFFSRNTVYSNLGYDCFESLEYMVEPTYTSIGWCRDEILTDEILLAMDSSQKRDLVYTIAVESHGKYSDTYEYSEGDPEVLAYPEELSLPQIQNYIHYAAEVDTFTGDLIRALQAYDEPVVLILYGDHLPALGLSNELLSTGTVYASHYIIWNNYAADFTAEPMQSYRLGAELLRQMGINEGIMTRFHQSYALDDESDAYLSKLQTLEYDMLSGNQEAYGELGIYPPTDMKLGIRTIRVTQAEKRFGRLLVTGENFTEFSRIVYNGTILNTVYVDSSHLTAVPAADFVKDYESVITVAQVSNAGDILSETDDFPVSDIIWYNERQ